MCKYTSTRSPFILIIPTWIGPQLSLWLFNKGPFGSGKNTGRRGHNLVDFYKVSKHGIVIVLYVDDLHDTTY
jgi:hypothetical protein